MEPKEIVDELKSILVTRLRFDPRRAAELTLETALPKGVEGSIGLDSLDFIELSIAIEERFGVVLDESQDLADGRRRFSRPRWPIAPHRPRSHGCSDVTRVSAR